jgi:hypothetical protein
MRFPVCGGSKKGFWKILKSEENNFCLRRPKPFLLISCKSLQKKQRFENTSLTWENGHAVHAAGVADPFLLISCKSLQKKQRFENTSLTWENGHAVHAAGVADPFLLISCKNAQKKQRFPGWFLSNVMNDAYRVWTPSTFCKKGSGLPKTFI